MNLQILLYFVNFILYMGFSLVAPIIPPLIIERGGNSFISGLFIGIFSLTQIITITLTPKILSILERRTFFIISTSIQSISILLYSILNNLYNKFYFYFFAFLIRGTHGLSDGALAVSIYGTTNIISKGPELANILGYMEFIGSLGGALGPLVITIFYNLGGYKVPFIVTFFISALCTSGFIFTKFNIQEEKSNNNTSKNIFLYLKNKNILILFIIGIINIYAQLYYYPILTNHLIQRFQISINLCSIFFIFPLLTYSITVKFIDKILNKFDNKITIILGLIIFIFSSLFMAPIFLLPNSLITISLGLFILGVGQAFLNITFIIEANYYLKQEYGMNEEEYGDISSALFCLTFNIGSFISGPISGFIKLHFNYAYSCYFSALLCLSILVYYFFNYKQNILLKYNEIISGKNDEIKQTLITN